MGETGHCHGKQNKPDTQCHLLSLICEIQIFVFWVVKVKGALFGKRKGSTPECRPKSNDGHDQSTLCTGVKMSNEPHYLNINICLVKCLKTLNKQKHTGSQCFFEVQPSHAPTSAWAAHCPDAADLLLIQPGACPPSLRCWSPPNSARGLPTTPTLLTSFKPKHALCSRPPHFIPPFPDASRTSNYLHPSPSTYWKWHPTLSY